ncbi:efflux RND transporter permease subunit [Aliiroseovarius sp. F20344]|uniref:efflux RND transporter permease subunit n=1 Tax=Aliiroseovarius sp. F20344 TaxID=2926414 RepID=UPI001FF0E43D|nr:efflux RND transporter permease subunit [Aliiroseovarius sp. F20344]MCK0142849.1 efflux RND transporter permease subunit [Aliiroseovarius sp. F20344]
MSSLIDFAFARARVILMALAAILALGTWAYNAIPKEANPEIPIPVVYVVTTLDGVSPEDAERLLVNPLETELGSISGLDDIISHAGEGYASVQMEFNPDLPVDEALDKVREAVDSAKGELPSDATEPSVHEINTALFPIMNIVLSGPVPERTLNDMATVLQDDIEALPGVLEVDIGGTREDLLEVLVDPTVFETYNITFAELITQVTQNNLLVAAGSIDTGAGRMVLKVPGLIENVQSVMDLPIKVSGGTVVTFSDVATVRRTFKDPESFARIDGQPALVLEVKKRVGANVIDTVAAVREVLSASQETYPETVRVQVTYDQSDDVVSMLDDLEANVITAVILVMIVIVWALGFRSALLVGLAIPGAFLAGVTAIWAMGYTMNIVVLFALILVVGMLVDGAIVTTELADRKLQEGTPPRKAYASAAKRMAWPIIASTATTLSVFFPLLFWSGVIGEFMKFLPITVMLTLGASLFMALIFIPVLGGLIGRRQPQTARSKAALEAAESGDPRDIPGFTGAYVRLLNWAILHPAAVVILAVAALLGGFGIYGQFGKGLTFFPEPEPSAMVIEIRARDNFSIYERDALVRKVENRLIGHPEVDSVYARTVLDNRDDQEVIGTLQLRMNDWDTRRPVAEIIPEIRADMDDVAGVVVQVQTQSEGPTGGKPVQLKLSSDNRDDLNAATTKVLGIMDSIGGFTDVTDTRALPGVEWALRVDREEAARFGADIAILGQAVQLLTQGVGVATYRPDDVDGSVDIRVRFPAQDRTLDELQTLRVPTAAGLVPISNFVRFEPVQRSGRISHEDQQRVISVAADIAPGLLVNNQIIALKDAITQAGLPGDVTFDFGGEAEEQEEAMVFLVGAFLTAIILMFATLLLQFNSFYQAFVVMSAIVFSIAGVLMGLLITGRPFGVVMGGIGVIALAGIVVNNNIVLIDTYNVLRSEGMSPLEAALRTGAQRLRPVVLTSITTALGLMPMVLALTISFGARTIQIGAPSSQWWTELSSAIAGGLVFATVLTLIVTPAMLMLGERRWFKEHRRAS